MTVIYSAIHPREDRLCAEKEFLWSEVVGWSDQFLREKIEEARKELNVPDVIMLTVADVDLHRDAYIVHWEWRQLMFFSEEISL